MAFLDFYKSLPNIDGIILNPQTFTAPEKPELLFAISAALASRADINNFSRVIAAADALRNTTWEELPTQYNIVNAFAELENHGFQGAHLIETIGGTSIAETRRID